MPGARIALADVEPRPRRIAVGVFDGVHLGHREVVRGADCVLTFDPHPLAVLAPARAPRLVTTLDRRVELLGEQGVREVVVIPFDLDFASLSAQQFIDEILVGRLRATQVSVGENFRFGRGGAGDAELLRADTRFVTRAVPLVTVDGTIVSSSVIRSLLADGDVDRAGRLLGGRAALAM